MITGENSTFSCAVLRATFVSWNAYHPDDTFDKQLDQDTQDVIMLTTATLELQGIINSTITINSKLTWNNTIIRCEAEYHGSDEISNRASLIVHSSLSNLFNDI